MHRAPQRTLFGSYPAGFFILLPTQKADMPITTPLIVGGSSWKWEGWEGWKGGIDGIYKGGGGGREVNSRQTLTTLYTYVLTDPQKQIKAKYRRRQKTFPLSFNTIPFGFVIFCQKPNGNCVQRRSITFRFVLVQFHSVSLRSVPCAEYRTESKCPFLFAEESQSRWSTFCFPDALSCSRSPPYDKEKPWDTLFKSGRIPQIANRSRVRQSLLAQSRRINETIPEWF